MHFIQCECGFLNPRPIKNFIDVPFRGEALIILASRRTVALRAKMCMVQQSNHFSLHSRSSTAHCGNSERLQPSAALARSEHQKSQQSS